MSDQRLVKLAELWERTSAKGARYFSGYMGAAQLLLFKDGEKLHPTRPDETVIVWKLLVQERDPEHRPQQRRQQPTRGQSTWDPSCHHDLPTSQAREYRNEQRDPRQQHTDELAARLEPDEELPF